MQGSNPGRERPPGHKLDINHLDAFIKVHFPQHRATLAQLPRINTANIQA